MKNELKIEYSIERHLTELCLSNPDFEILNAIWKLNKKKLGLGLNSIFLSFPHYSHHDNSHSNTIIRNIESFLGEDRIKRLSPSDSFLILMSAYTHDIGMILLNSIIQKEWETNKFKDFLICTQETSNDKDLVKAAKVILDFSEVHKEKTKDDFSWALEVRNAVILLTADYFRREHHLRGKEYIDTENGELKKITEDFYSDQLPSRFLDLLGDIAYAHGISFSKVLEKLDFQSNGFQSDKIHPRFIAFLIRLGDLLDIDDNRFDNFHLAQLYKIPDSTYIHREKHSSIKHFLICPQSIEVRVDCKNEDVYRTARQWFDWLIDEVEKQSKEWALITPQDLGGLPPVILNGKIQILYRGALPKNELMDLRFTISNQRIFEMFEGAALYDDAEFVFLREIVQNSIDATKIQIWKDICNGSYDFILDPHLKELWSELRNTDSFNIISNIRFPDDIPDSIYINYPITLTIDWNEKDPNLLTIICEDHGTGISEDNLIRMTRKVGESRKNDRIFQAIKNDLPFWLKPTGAFGIGLQTLFILTDSFIIQTKAENESPKEIIFRSAKNQNYCSITDNQPDLKRGTKLILNIKKERFSELFKNSFPIEIISSYDYFTDKKGSIYLYKMQDYLLKELSNIEFLRIKFLDDGYIKQFNQKSTTTNLTKIDSYSSSDRVRKIISYETSESLPFIIFESHPIGTEIYFDFISTFENISLDYIQPHFRNLYFVRDIPIKDNTYGFYRASYFRIMWNLLSPESDKVLNLSRNKLIDKTRYKLNDSLLYEIFPIVLPEIKDLFENNYNKFHLNESSKACTYFHIVLSCLINEKADIEINKQLLGELRIPNLLIKPLKNEKDEIYAKDFFDLKKLAVISGNTLGTNQQNFQIRQELYDSVKEDLKNKNVDAVIFANLYFDTYVRWYYEINNIFIKENKGSVYILEKKQQNRVKPVSVDEHSKKQILSGLIVGNYLSASRQHIYSIEPYCYVLSTWNRFKGGFEYFPYLSSHSILSPFKNKTQADEVFNDLDKVKLVGEKMTDYILLTHISNLITDKMVKHIIKDHSFDKFKIDEKMIRMEYAKLIFDFYTNSPKKTNP